MGALDLYAERCRYPSVGLWLVWLAARPRKVPSPVLLAFYESPDDSWNVTIFFLLPFFSLDFV